MHGFGWFEKLERCTLSNYTDMLRNADFIDETTFDEIVIISLGEISSCSTSMEAIW
ncbi:hypothetical protein BGZ61DRAFT_423038, partial [Ilyonectria robusta]|uniref:uncharacterized protein n=1 Tax=Ilyonectria robusta TaxID=1079257 RepID=UPI001E8D7053